MMLISLSMKKILTVLVLLVASFSPVFADGKANTKVGNVKILADSNKGHNVTVSKSGNLFNVAVVANKFVISSNPVITNMALSISFGIDEEDLVSGTTYQLNSNGNQTNAIIVASFVKGSKGGGIASTLESQVTGSLKVISYNSDTGRLKAVVTAKLTPSTKTTIANGTSNEVAVTKAVPINIKLDATLD